MKRKINAIWKGDGADGTGVLTAQSGAFNNMRILLEREVKL